VHKIGEEGLVFPPNPDFHRRNDLQVFTIKVYYSTKEPPLSLRTVQNVVIIQGLKTEMDPYDPSVSVLYDSPTKSILLCKSI